MTKLQGDKQKKVYKPRYDFISGKGLEDEDIQLRDINDEIPVESPKDYLTDRVAEFEKVYMPLYLATEASIAEDFHDRLKAFLTESIQQSMEVGISQERERLLGAILSGTEMKKPTHGTCCTCQTCGGDKDYCSCESNFQQVIKNIADQRKALSDIGGKI